MWYTLLLLLYLKQAYVSTLEEFLDASKCVLKLWKCAFEWYINYRKKLRGRCKRLFLFAPERWKSLEFHDFGEKHDKLVIIHGNNGNVSEIHWKFEFRDFKVEFLDEFSKRSYLQHVDATYLDQYYSIVRLGRPRTHKSFSELLQSRRFNNRAAEVNHV